MQENIVLDRILDLLLSHTDIDFRKYKKSTLLRRIERRMHLCNAESFVDYLRILQENPDEVIALHQDLLIGVTSFFRDLKAWREIENLVIPEIVRLKTSNIPIRIWIPGCSTGEEAYTIAMLITHHMERMNERHHLTIFATDVNDRILDTTSTGKYPYDIVQDIPSAFFDSYIEICDKGFQITKYIRERIAFSKHNIIDDPPFENIDLISCRNLLIYLEPEIQQRIIGQFHTALNPGGFLFLGISESLGRWRHKFDTLSRKWRIFRRSDG